MARSIQVITIPTVATVFRESLTPATMTAIATSVRTRNCTGLAKREYTGEGITGGIMPAGTICAIPSGIDEVSKLRVAEE